MGRTDVVNRQYSIEIKMAKHAEKGAAVFFVPSLLTPMFVNRKHVEKNAASQLFQLKQGPEADKTIPDGLIPQNKLDDPQQLSTVLQRVISINELLAVR
jgi:hypothetical protein